MRVHLHSSRMRFLRHTSPAQIRLGWLRVIAGLVGMQRMPFTRLQAELSKHMDASVLWLADAEFTEAPRGNVPPTKVDRLVRMGVNYGIHSEETTALTDLGHVLRMVAPWSPESPENALVWRDAARWIGLWIVVQAAGDVLIPLVRMWSTPEQTTAETAKMMVEVLSSLSRQAAPEEQGILRQQAHGLKKREQDFDGRTTLYPYVEPLRDLGYLERTVVVGGGPGYRLTEAGSRIRDGLCRLDGDAEALLRSGISRVFLLGEGVSALRPASGLVLADVLATMPPELTVLRPEEVPLEPAVLIAQAKLLRDTPGTWIDYRRAHDLLKAVGQRGAKVEVKRGDSERELHVAWQGAQDLADQTLWNVDVEVHDPFMKTPALVPTDQPILPLALPPPELAHPTECADHGAPENPDPMLRSDIPAPLRLWLQYVDHFLSPPAQGALDFSLWGGIEAGLLRLKALLALSPHLLHDKRSLLTDIILHPRAQQPSRKPLCLHSIHRLKRPLEQVQEDWIIDRTDELWLDGDKDGRRDPRAAVERGIRHTPVVAKKLRDLLIHPFLEATEIPWKDWDLTKDATRAIVQDAIARGMWSSRTLRVRLHRELRRRDGLEAARCWLDLLFAEPHKMIYTQRRRIPVDICDRLNLDRSGQPTAEDDAMQIRVESDTREDGSRVTAFVLHVQARSAFEARNAGRQKVQALLAERYAKCSPCELDTPVDLHGRLDYEHVEPLEHASDEHVDREESENGFHGLSGLTFARPANSRSSFVVPAAEAARGMQGDALGPRHRLAHARRELIGARGPGLRNEQRLMLAWMAMEKLVSSGKEGKGKAITVLAAAASLIHLRAEILRILCDARAALWLTACLKPQDETIQPLVDLWLTDLPPNMRAVIGPETSEAMRRAQTMTPLPPIPALEALQRLWEHRENVATLKGMLMLWAPLAAAGLHDFLVITGDMKDMDHVGDGHRLADHFSEIYKDISSFFAHVYELRNRTVHGEGTMSLVHDDPSTVEIYQRFITLAEPVLEATEKWVDEGMSLEQVWALAIDKAQDLAGLPYCSKQVPDEPVSSRPSGSMSGPPEGTGKEHTDRRMPPSRRSAAKPLSLERIMELLSF